MSLRKRTVHFRWGQFPFWRLLHSILGVSAVLVLIAHTGLRFGSNLNFILMSSFLGATALGAFAGITTGFEQRLAGAAGRSLRRNITWAHVLLVWPLPVLIAFHILLTYYF